MSCVLVLMLVPPGEVFNSKAGNSPLMLADEPRRWAFMNERMAPE